MIQFIQLQSLTNIISLNNKTTRSYPINAIRVTILPTSRLIGFFLDFTNSSSVSGNTTSLLESSLSNPFPKTTKRQTKGVCLGSINLQVNILINSVNVTPSPIIIRLATTNNGKVTEVRSLGKIGNLKASLILSYNYVQTDLIYKWLITDCQLNLSLE